MNYYNAKFLKNGVAQGVEYLFKCEDELAPGDVVLHRTKKKVVITSVADDDFVEMIRGRIGEHNIGMVTKDAGEG